jgi:hypothetical protein
MAAAATAAAQIRVYNSRSRASFIRRSHTPSLVTFPLFFVEVVVAQGLLRPQCQGAPRAARTSQIGAAGFGGGREENLELFLDMYRLFSTTVDCRQLTAFCWMLVLLTLALAPAPTLMDRRRHPPAPLENPEGRPTQSEKSSTALLPPPPPPAGVGRVQPGALWQRRRQRRGSCRSGLAQSSSRSSPQRPTARR